MRRSNNESMSITESKNAKKKDSLNGFWKSETENSLMQKPPSSSCEKKLLSLHHVIAIQNNTTFKPSQNNDSRCHYGLERTGMASSKSTPRLGARGAPLATLGSFSRWMSTNYKHHLHTHFCVDSMKLKSAEQTDEICEVSPRSNATNA